MEKMYMSASIVVTIVLCVIGLIKLPFKKFKNNHPSGYKVLFTATSFILSIGLSILNQIYILCDEVISINFAILLATVIAGVFAGYGGIYEGLGVKQLMKKITESLKKAKEISTHEKTIKFLNKVQNIDEAIDILVHRKQDTEV